MYSFEVDGAFRKVSPRYGAIAQLVEHLHGMQGVRSSSLLGSILENTVLDEVFGGHKTAFLLSGFSLLWPARAVLLLKRL